MCCEQLVSSWSSFALHDAFVAFLYSICFFWIRLSVSTFVFRPSLQISFFFWFINHVRCHVVFQRVPPDEHEVFLRHNVTSSCAPLAIVSLSYAIILCFTWQCTLLLFCAVYNKTSCTFVMLLHCTAILYFSQNSFFCTSCILLFCISHKMASCTTCIYSHYM